MASSNSDFLAQLLMLGFGWFIVHRLSLSRDRDKARREMLAKASDVIDGLIDKLLESGSSYHAKERDVLEENKIKIALKDVGNRISSLKLLCSDDDLADCRRKFIKLKQSITSSNFEYEHVPIESYDNKIHQDISAAVVDMKFALNCLKFKQFPK